MIIQLAGETIAGSDREGHSNLRINGRQILQEASFLRAESVKEFNRKNHSTSLSFRTSKLFTDQADAEVWMLERFPLLLDLCGLLTLTAKSENKEIERYIETAAISDIGTSEVGVTIYLDWQIRGGKILTTKPTST